MKTAVLLLTLVAAGCRTAATAHPGDALWSALQPLCGKAFEGRLIEGSEPSDAKIGAERLVIHVRSCTDGEIRIPFQVGNDRSRTFVLTRTAAGVRLKHDHRHADGTPDQLTEYGGDTRGASDALRLQFFADAETAAMLPAAASNVWTLAIEEGRTFTYALHRERSDRRFRVDFDLSNPVPDPPPPW